MTYNVIFPPDERGTGDRTFQIMQTDLAKIGISISQQNMDDSATFNAISAPNSKYETFDMAMWDWVPPVDPDFMLSVMTCAQLGNNSDSGYCNPAYDKMYAKQGTLIAASAQARADLADAAVHLRRQAVHHPRLPGHHRGALDEVDRLRRLPGDGLGELAVHRDAAERAPEVGAGRRSGCAERTMSSGGSASRC